MAPGRLLAAVAHDKLLLPTAALAAQIAGAQSTLDQARSDLARSDPPGVAGRVGRACPPCLCPSRGYAGT